MYLRAELIRLAEKPDANTVLERARARAEAAGTTLSAEKTLEYRDAGRR